MKTTQIMACGRHPVESNDEDDDDNYDDHPL